MIPPINHIVTPQSLNYIAHNREQDPLEKFVFYQYPHDAGNQESTYILLYV